MTRTSAAQRRAHAQLLQALDDSGLTQRDFAETILLRDERVVRRWINGHAPIPSLICRFLNAWSTTHHTRSNA